MVERKFWTKSLIYGVIFRKEILPKNWRWLWDGIFLGPRIRNPVLFEFFSQPFRFLAFGIFFVGWEIPKKSLLLKMTGIESL